MNHHHRALDLAGIHDPRLRASYTWCRRLHAAYGKTYYLGTLLLPPAKRPFVHALYGFARHADDLVDNAPAGSRAACFEDWAERALADIHAGSSDDVVCRAVVHTIHTWDIPVPYFEAFIASMRTDLTVTEFASYPELRAYMYGSAAVIGLQMLPILEPATPRAVPRARALGEAFQLTNFIRDVPEDLDRGRVYLPVDELHAHHVNRADLERRELTPALADALRAQIARARALYDYAEPGIDMLHSSSRPCMRTAVTLYRDILTEIENQHCDVFRRRARVGMPRRAAVAWPAWRASRAYRRSASPVGGRTLAGAAR